MKNAILLLALVMAGAITPALSQTTTFSIQTYPILANTQVAADFNGDGKPDLAGGGGTGASVQLNNGDGSFGPKMDFPVGTWTQDVGVGDFNNDGKLDVVKRRIDVGGASLLHLPSGQQ
jgi:hypothetical protein